MERTAIFGEAVAGHEVAVRRSLVELTADITRHTFDVAELLYEVQEKKLYGKWGFENFSEYAERELNLKVRKAQYLARIVKVCREVGVKRADYEQVGVTRLREICTLDPETTFYDSEQKEHTPMVDHIVDLLSRAVEMSTVEVAERVAELKGQVGDNRMLLRSYKVTKTAYENTIQPALEVMRKLLGSKGRDGTGAAVDYPDGACLEYICREFLNDPHNFLEESDESRQQIEVPLEEGTNVSTRSTLRDGVNGAELCVANEEATQDTLHPRGTQDIRYEN